MQPSLPPCPLRPEHHTPNRSADVIARPLAKPDSQNDVLLLTGKNEATFDSSIDRTSIRLMIDPVRAIAEPFEHTPPCPSLALRHRCHRQALRATRRHQLGEPFTGCSAPPVESSLERGS